MATTAALLVTLAAIPALGQQTMSLEPNSGPPGTQVTVAVANASPGQPFVVWWVPLPDAVGTIEVGEGIVDGDGSVNLSFNVPGNATPGTYRVEFRYKNFATGGSFRLFEAVAPATTTTSTTPATTSTTTTTTTTTSTTSTTMVDATPPSAADDSISTEAGASVLIPVLDNDNAGDSALDPSSFSITLAPARGIATHQGDGVVLYEPGAGYVGVDRFNYEICDGAMFCDRATVTVEVTACPYDETLVTSFTVDPTEALPGELMVLDLRLDSERLSRCFATMIPVSFVLNGQRLAGPLGSEELTAVEVEVPAALEAGAYLIAAQIGEPGATVAEVPFSIGESDNRLPQWIVFAVIALVALAAGTSIGIALGRRGRTHATGSTPP